MSKENLALDTQNWASKSPDQVIVDFSSALVEQRETNLYVERLYSGRLYIENGVLVDPVYGPLDNLKNQTPQDILENKAVKNIIERGQKNDCATIIWISPPSETYDETRFIIYLPTKEEDNIALDYITIPAPHNTEACLAISRQLQAFSDIAEIVSGLDDLRSTPIPITDIYPYPNWIELMQDTIYFPEVWEAIKKGKHIENTLKAKQASKPIIERNYQQIQYARGINALLIGAQIEREAEARGYRLQISGSCGHSNRAVLGDLMNRNSPYTSLFSLPLNGRAEEFISSEGKKGPSLFCSTCNKNVNTYIVGGIIYCSLCHEPLGKASEEKKN